MKKQLHKKILISTSSIILLIVLAFIIYPFKTGLIFNFKRVTYSNEKLVSEYFNLDISDSSYVKELSIEKDLYPFDYVMDVKLIIPEQEINKIFRNYKNMQKLTEEARGWFDSQLFVGWGIDKNNFDYKYIWFEDARRNHLFGFGYTQTQKSPIIIFTKPVKGNVSVFMTRDKLGWE